MRRIGASLASLAAFLLAWKLVTVVGSMPEYILPAPEVVAEVRAALASVPAVELRPWAAGAA